MSGLQENHSTALYFKTQPPDFSPPFWLCSKKEIIFYFLPFLIAWPLACKVERGGNMHIEEELCTKLFYYVYLCKWHIRLFKKVSVAPPLIALWSVFPVAVDRVCDWLYTNLYKRRKYGDLIVFQWLSSKFKMKECRILQTANSSSSSSLNSGCLLKRWTVYSYLPLII